MHDIITTIKKLPLLPGCYLFYDEHDVLLYVGKAKQLRNRVRSYFTKNADLAPAKKIMVSRIAKVDFVTVRTEEEALLLESNLIKKHKPPYNVILKDDKFFQYIKIVNESFPRILTTRKRINDGSQYFGPYSSAAAVKQTLRLLKKLFPFRTQTKYDFVFDVLKAGETISQKEYSTIINSVTNILKGDTKRLLKNLETKMRKASNARHYEQAAQYRDHIEYLKRLSNKQQAIFTDNTSADIFNYASFKNTLYIAILKIRNGRLVDKLTAFVEDPLETATESIRSFVLQYYNSLSDIPKHIVLPKPIPQLADELSSILLQTTKLKIPQRGKFKQLLELALLNAEMFAQQSEIGFIAAQDITSALRELKQKLKLKKTPKRIECFDISNVQGSHAVGSMVVFTNGVPDKNEYRKFGIKYTPQHTPNDFAMMAEVVGRRFRHDDWPRPDLVILDGGKGQLSVVLKTLSNLSTTVPIVALAKKNEEIFIPNKPFNDPKQTYTKIQLSKKSAPFFLIQRIRDEAHRFAITYYRQKHRKSLTK